MGLNNWLPEVHRLRELAPIGNGSITPHRGCLTISRFSQLAEWLRRYSQYQLTGVVFPMGILIANPSDKLASCFGEGKLITLKCQPVPIKSGYRVVRLESETLCYLGDPAYTCMYSDPKTSAALIKSMLKLD